MHVSESRDTQREKGWRQRKKNSLQFALVQSRCIFKTGNFNSHLEWWKFYSTYLHILAPRFRGWMKDFQPTILNRTVFFVLFFVHFSVTIAVLRFGLGSVRFGSVQLVPLQWNTGNTCRCCDNDVDANDIVVLWKRKRTDQHYTWRCHPMPFCCSTSWMDDTKHDAMTKQPNRKKKCLDQYGRKDLQKKNREKRRGAMKLMKFA